MAGELQNQYRALVLPNVGSDFEIEQRPTLEAYHGSAIVRVLAANILSYHKEVYEGTRLLTFPLPLVGGKRMPTNG